MNNKELSEYFDKQVDRFIAVISDYKDASNQMDKARQELQSAKAGYSHPKLDALKKFVFIIWPVLIILVVVALRAADVPVRIEFGKLKVTTCDASEVSPERAATDLP